MRNSEIGFSDDVPGTEFCPPGNPEAIMTRLVRVIGLAVGLGITAYAGTVYSYTDTINDGSFATASYSLTANNAKVITASSFSDGNSKRSGAETADTPNMREPGSGN